MNTPKLEELNSNNCTEKSIQRNFPEFYEYIIKNYPLDLKWTEKLYWYYHDIKEHPRCLCGNPLPYLNLNKGYAEFCSRECDYFKESIYSRVKQTKLKRYGDENYNNQEKNKCTCLERYGVTNGAQSIISKEHQKATNLERYGVEYFTRSQRYKDQKDSIQENLKMTCRSRYGVDHAMKSETSKQRMQETCLERYGVKTNFLLDSNKEKAKQTCIKRYGVNYYVHSKDYKNRVEDILQKSYNTKRTNHTFSTSSIEEQFSSYLDSQNIIYKRQYSCERYSFACDFYIPKYDLFIEINGSWVHGYHPYNNSKEDKETVDRWRSKNTKYYNNAIQTWTIRDVKKREIAKQNNLNYLEIFSIDIEEVVKVYEEYISQI